MLSNRVKKFDVKSFLLLLLFNILALLPLICFAFQHFSIDSYGIVDNIHTHFDALISSYRYFGAFLFYLWTFFGHNPIINSLPDTIFYIILVALSNTAMTKFICSKLGGASKCSTLIINTSTIISFFNVWFCNYLNFSECIFFSAVSIFLCYLSLMIFFSNKLPRIIRLTISGFLLICITAVIQQYLIVFIVYSILLTSITIHNSDYKVKTTIWKYISLLLFIISCSVIYFLIGVIILNVFHFTPNSRVALDFNVILNNLKYFAFNQHSYLKGRGFFNTEILTVCYLVVIAIWIISFVYYIKKHKFNAKAVFLLISYIAAYASSFGMGLISTSRSHRTMFGLFSVFALFSIGSILLMNNKITKRILCVVLLVVYGLSVFKTVEMSINQYKGNTTEKVYANLYLSEINAYEKSTGNTVKNIEICTDKHCDTAKGESALTVKYAFEPLMKYISNRDFIVKKLTDNQIKKEFENKDWNEYNPNEQMIFNGDTLYLCVY